MPRSGSLRSARLTSSGTRARAALRGLRRVALAAAAAGLLAACASGDSGAPKPPPAPIIGAQLRPTGDSRTTGVVTFDPVPGGLRANVSLTGTGGPGRWRVVIHTTGICTSPNGFSAGPPFVPPGATEPPTILVTTTEDGVGSDTVRLPGIAIEGPAGIMGKSVIVHDGATGSLEAQPGVRNDRIACGVIGIVKPLEL